MSDSSDTIDLDFLRRIDQVCTQFENADPDEREIETFCRGYSGEQRSALLRELIALDTELRERDGQSSQPSDYSRFSDRDPSLTDAIPSGFLNTNFQQLLGEDSPADVTSSRYQIGPSIGIGGIGEVYRVFDSHSQRSLALKTLHRRFLGDESAVNRFHREGLLTGTLQHPGIPPVYDHGLLDDGTPFFSMKLVDGQTLQQILKSRVPNNDDLGDLIVIFESVAQTLAYAHTQQVVHRDVKPQNIMVGRFGEVQVMDWGLAKRLGADPILNQEGLAESRTPDVSSGQLPPASPPDSEGTPHGSDLTTAGDIVGTPGYMAPEQARGEVDSLDTRADVFALGAILFQILCRRTLFPNDSRIRVIEKTQQGDLTEALQQLDRHDQDAELVSLCRRCLDPDATGRPVDSTEVARVTRDYLAGLERRMRQAEIERSQSEVRVTESRKRQRWIIGMTSALTSVAVLSSVVVGIQWRKATRAAISESVARDNAEKEAATTTEINDFLNGVLSSNLPSRRGHDVTLREVIDDALPELEGKFVGRPQVEGKIRRTLGESYRWLGESFVAEDQLRRSLAAFQRARPIDQFELLDTKDRLAGVLRSRGGKEDLAEAEQLRHEVLTQTRERLGNAHPRTFIAMNNLGTVLLEMNRLNEAGELFREALDQMDSIPETNSADRIALLVNLADIDRMTEQWESAEVSYLKVIEDPNSSTRERDNAMVQLGEMLHGLDRYDDSIRYLSDVYQLRQKVLGPLNPLTLSAMRKLSRATEAAKRYDELIPLLDESLDRHQAAEGGASGRICEARSLMAKALIGLDRQEEAIAYMKETIDLISKERGADHKYAFQAKQQLDEFQCR